MGYPDERRVKDRLAVEARPEQLFEMNAELEDQDTDAEITQYQAPVVRFKVTTTQV